MTTYTTIDGDKISSAVSDEYFPGFVRKEDGTLEKTIGDPRCFYDREIERLKEENKKNNNKESPLALVNQNNKATKRSFNPNSSDRVKDKIFYLNTKFAKDVRSLEKPMSSAAILSMFDYDESNISVDDFGIDVFGLKANKVIKDFGICFNESILKLRICQLSNYLYLWKTEGHVYTIVKNAVLSACQDRINNILDGS